MRRYAITTVAALAAALLVGCGATGPAVDRSSSGDDMGSAPMEQETVEYAADVDFDGAEMSTEEAGTAQAPAIITVGDARVMADDPVAASQDFTQKVTAAGGSISNSWQRTSGDEPYVEVTARIPSDEFQTVLDFLPELGEVESQSTNSDDVTTQLTDINARIEALQTSVDRLNGLMENAETTADLLEAEEMLTQRQAELDSLASTQDYLLDQVSMSTLSVEFSTTPETSGPSVSWGDAWTTFIESIIYLLNAVVFLLPWLVLIAVIVIVWRVVRRARKKRAARRMGEPIVMSAGSSD